MTRIHAQSGICTAVDRAVLIQDYALARAAVIESEDVPSSAFHITYLFQFA